MKFICNKSIFLNELNIASNIISKSSSLVELSDIYLEAKDNKLIIQATDLKLSMQSEIEIESSENGIILLNFKKLYSIIQNLPDGFIQFEKNENTILIKFLDKKIKYKLSIQNDFNKFIMPELPDKSEGFKIPLNVFSYMVKSVFISISQDLNRPSLNGIYFDKNNENINMVATDGKRLSLANTKLFNDGIIDDCTIPEKVLILFKKLQVSESDMYIKIENRIIYFWFENKVIVSSLIDDKFPDYKKFVFENNRFNLSIELNKQAFEEAIKRVSVINYNENKIIFLAIKENQLYLSTKEDIGEAEELLECKYSGNEFNFIFNYNYLLQALSEIDDKDIVFSFTEINTPIMIKTKDDSIMHIIASIMV